MFSSGITHKQTNDFDKNDLTNNDFDKQRF